MYENTCLSHDLAVIGWITSCNKNRMTTRVITLWRVHVTSLSTSVSTVRFLAEIVFIFKAIKSLLKVGSCPNDDNFVQIYFSSFL